MTKPWRLTRRAERQLADIAAWTIERFGANQAELYEAEILERCDAIAGGRAHVRSCAHLVPGAESLNYARAGEHYVVFVDLPDVIVIAAFLHSRSDLPAHLAEIVEH